MKNGQSAFPGKKRECVLDINMEVILNGVWKLRENIKSKTECMEIIKINAEINGLQEKGNGFKNWHKPFTLNRKPGVVVHVCNLSTREAMAGELLQD